jgi:hypothetical protein
MTDERWNQAQIAYSTSRREVEVRLAVEDCDVDRLFVVLRASTGEGGRSDVDYRVGRTVRLLPSEAPGRCIGAVSPPGRVELEGL